MKPINIFLFLALLSAAAALPVLDNTTPPPTAAQAEEPALINAASIPKIVIPPLPSAPHKPEQPPPPPPTAEPIPLPPIADAAYADDVELDDLVADGSDDSDGPDGDHDDDDDGDSEISMKGKQQQLKAFVQNTTTNAKHTKLEAKKMTCSIENDHLVCASVDLSKVEFEPTECTTATDNNNVAICRRSLAAYSSSDGESH